MSESDIVLVTGSSGFIGRALVYKLAQQFPIICFDRKEPQSFLPARASFRST